jgi:HPt (histidine-containing phosphotransfer) domain-containing protein
LAELFILECPKHLNQMRAALRDNNAKNLAHSAHTLKGSAGNFSSKGIYETAQELELLAREGKLDGVPELLKTLEDQLAHFNQILAGMIAQTVR